MDRDGRHRRTMKKIKQMWDRKDKKPSSAAEAKGWEKEKKRREKEAGA